MSKACLPNIKRVVNLCIRGPDMTGAIRCLSRDYFGADCDTKRDESNANCEDFGAGVEAMNDCVGGY